MRGTNERHHHDPAAVALRLCAALLAVGICVPPAAAQEVTRVPLPTEQDAVAVALGAEAILYGPFGVERTLPGPVSDREEIFVQLAPDGSLARVVVEQRLEVTGLGDFSFRVPGPARDVEPLPGSESSPGLRRGSMLWQGFSDGERSLGARAELFADQEAERMPIRAELSVTVDGRALALGARASGLMSVDLRIENATAIPIQVVDARAPAGAVEPVLERARATIEAGRRPRPGEGGIPKSVPALAPVGLRTEEVPATFDVEGTIAFPPGVVAEAIEGGDPFGANVVRFKGQLRDRAIEVHAEADVIDGTLPKLSFTARPAPPRVRSGSGDSLADLMRLMWEVARLRQYDGYLGNPDPTGPSSAVYTFSLAGPPRADARPAAEPLRTLGAFGTAMALLALLLVLGVAALAWSLS